MEPLCWRKRFCIALEIARGAEYLHSFSPHTFIHRNLKSSNILLGADYCAKISDFGLVKLFEDEKKFVKSRPFGYIAPEYAGSEIQTNTFIFSFVVCNSQLICHLF